jgi:hypothetical protein
VARGLGGGIAAWTAAGHPTRSTRCLRTTTSGVSVELEHRRIERHGDTAAAVQGAVDSPQGWSYLLGVFAEHAAA